jgi:phosphoribosylformimino-5-aminoimidazole carboxamide ribotide isomerase
MRIIPAIDIIEGKCVRLTKGDYDTKKIYNEDPLEVALSFEGHGISCIHVVDLDGAKSNQIVNYKILERLASKTALKIDFGGGLKTEKDLQIAFDSGAAQVTGGSIAVKNRKEFLNWLKRYGKDKIILGADCRDEKIAVSGWTEESDRAVIPFIKGYQQDGIQKVICTDISKDGMLAGPSFELYKRIMDQTQVMKTTVTSSGVEDVLIPGIHLIASGGITTMSDLEKLAELGCEAAIVGKAIYEHTISMSDIEQYLLNN